MPYSKDGPLKQAAATALPLFALLLFNAPDGVTLRTLLPFHGLGERSHQERAGNVTGAFLGSNGAACCAVPFGVAAHNAPDEFLFLNGHFKEDFKDAVNVVLRQLLFAAAS